MVVLTVAKLFTPMLEFIILSCILSSKCQCFRAVWAYITLQVPTHISNVILF
jgi:hypothetical protein